MESQLSPTGRFDKILLATDGSEFSAGAVRVGLELAKRCGASLRVMSVVISNDEVQALAPQKIRQAESDARTHLDAIQAGAIKVGIPCESVVRHGDDPAVEIVDEAEKQQADVIVMGRRGRRGLARWMVGHATVKVIGTARCSVLVVPRAAKMWSCRILLATDGSRNADAAGIAAGNLARGCELPLTVLSVTTESHSEKRCIEARDAVDRTVALLNKEGVKAEGLVVEGKPDIAIVGTAKSRSADLVVVGSHGRTGLTKVMLGSISERVLSQSDWPVLVVKT